MQPIGATGEGRQEQGGQGEQNRVRRVMGMVAKKNDGAGGIYTQPMAHTIAKPSNSELIVKKSRFHRPRASGGRPRCGAKGGG